MSAILTLAGYVLGYALMYVACCAAVWSVQVLSCHRRRLRGLIEALKQRQRGWLMWRR